MFAWIKRLDHYLPIRYLVWALCIAGFVASVFAWLRMDMGPWLAIGFGVLVLTGLRDVLQTRHAILRNYPVIGHLRFLLEFIRPEIRQYFIEDDRDAAPFSRQQRSLVYQRAKGDSDKRPFGTQIDVGAVGYEWINHSMQPTHLQTHDFRVLIGAGRAQPYSASIFNISAMSFGSLSANAILALNAGAKRGNFAHDTGEGSISRHHRVHGGDLIWEIGSGYFGCRNDDGSFNADRFAENALWVAGETQSTHGSTPRAAAISSVTLGPGSTPPWPGFAPCDSFSSIILTCGWTALAQKRSSLNAPFSSQQPK